MGGGELYRNFDKKLSHAEDENYKLWKKYNLAKSSYDDLKNGKLFSVESFSLNYHNTVEYSRVYRQLEAGVDVSDRFWPPSDYLKKLLTIEKLIS